MRCTHCRGVGQRNNDNCDDCTYCNGTGYVDGVSTIRYVYIAGPIAKGVPAHNVRAAIDVADQLLALGFVPFLPHLSLFWDVVSPKKVEDWMQLDLTWIERCDAVLRIPGDSVGADREVVFADSRGIRVFYTVEALIVANAPRR